MSLANPATKSSSNRRRYPRSELDLPAVFLYQGNRQSRCRIRNFSKGGLYLEVLEPELPATAGSNRPASLNSDDAVVEIPGNQTGQGPLFSIPVRIAYRAAIGIGVAFSKEDPELLDYLRSLPNLRQVSGSTRGTTTAINLLPRYDRSPAIFWPVGLQPFFNAQETICWSVSMVRWTISKRLISCMRYPRSKRKAQVSVIR